MGSPYTSAEREQIRASLNHLFRGKLVISYLPTFRDDPNVNIFADYGFDADKLQKLLRKYNAVLWVKMHTSDQGLNSQQVASESLIFLSDEVLPDIYPLLVQTDVLITDYSSVYFDYLLLDRPIIFAPFDIDNYIRSRGFYYNYALVTPGPKAKNWDEVVNYIEEAINDPQKYQLERRRIKEKFHAYADGESSKRVFNEIMKFLGS